MYKAMTDKARTDKEIIYVINPTTYIVDNPNIKVRQAKLFCGACSSVENITLENSITLPIKGNVYNYDRVYGGCCLKKDCLEKFVKENEIIINTSLQKKF